MTNYLRQYAGSLLLIILSFAYLTRMYRLHLPEQYMFDEVYHAVTAKLIANDDPRAFEWWNPAPEPNTAVDWLHPPLAKYFQALSIAGFGENSFGWRFSSVVFGVLVVMMTYHLAVLLTKSEGVALTAAALSSLDGLLLTQSRIAMNDIHVTFFILLTFYVYAKFRQKPSATSLVLTGFCAGLALGSKWSGLFGLLIVWLLEGLRVLEIWAKNGWLVWFKKESLLAFTKQSVLYILALTIIPAVVYIASYGLMFLQGKDVAHFKDLHHQIWYYQTHLKETHPYQSRPWQWALDLRPVWYHVEYLDDQRADIYAFGNPVLYWTGLFAVGYTIYYGSTNVARQLKRTKKRRGQPAWMRILQKTNQSPLFFLTVSYFLLWVPWELSPRIMFFYHYAPAVPLLCIILGYWLFTLYKQKGGSQLAATITVFLIATTFLVWYPHWVGIPVSTEFKDTVYFQVPSWK